MRRVFVGALATLALGTAFLASTASAFLVNWDIDPAQSSFKLTIPDQNVTLGTVAATMRLRNQNNAAWTQNNAPVDGLLATNITPGWGNVQFLGGASSLVGVNTGSYRPNPASYSTAVTSTINTAGTFQNTSSAPAVYAARVNATAFSLNLNTGYIAFSNVTYDVASAAVALSGTSFLSNSLSIGVADSLISFDGINTGLAGQVVGDTQGNSGPIAAPNLNGAAGSLVNVGGANYRITVPINLPVFISLGGVNLNTTATGTLVGFATIPEPATIALTALGVGAIAAYARRRRQN